MISEFENIIKNNLFKQEDKLLDYLNNIKIDFQLSNIDEVFKLRILDAYKLIGLINKSDPETEIKKWKYKLISMINNWKISDDSRLKIKSYLEDKMNIDLSGD